MGEYANDQIRADMKRMFGFDPGDLNEKESRPKPPISKRVKCPHCDAHPKEKGLWQHVRDVHGISQVEQCLAKAANA